jgi:UDP-glucose 4-epimerase
MRVMVTGGAGYIGSVVTETLLQAGHEPTVYDNLSKGHRDAVPAGAGFLQGDILDGRTFEQALRETGAEAIVHMAGLIAVGESVARPDIYYRVNLKGSLEVLDAAMRANVRRLVFSSTAAVYGNPEQVPITEDHPTRPTSPYGETKLSFEHALRWYAQVPGQLRYTALRYFNACGATASRGERHDPETHLIPLALRAAAGQGDALTVFGEDWDTKDGTCVRDYVHVIDLARAHVLAIEALGAGGPSGVFNLGCGGDGYTVREVIASAERITGRRVPVRMGPRRPGDPAILVASSDRIRAELGWKPSHQDLDAIMASAWGFMSGQGAEAHAHG